MSEIQFLMIPSAPQPVAPYSHVVEVDGWAFITGQLATDPHDDSLPIPDGIEAQTHKVMDNLTRALEGVGLGLDRVVCVRIFLTNFECFCLAPEIAPPVRILHDRTHAPT